MRLRSLLVALAALLSLPRAQLFTPVASIDDFSPSLAELQRSLLNVGDHGEWLTVAEKLRNGTCLKIAAIGGSNTCKLEAFFEHLVAPLNARYPCEGRPAHISTSPPDSHEVLRCCAGGQGSDHWVEELSVVLANARAGTKPGLMTFEENVLSADIVIVETSINDWPICWDDDPAMPCWNAKWKRREFYTQRATELVVNQLRLLPRAPALLFTGLDNVGDPAWGGEVPRMSDGVYAQLEVLQHYGITQVSPMDGASPRLRLQLASCVALAPAGIYPSRLVANACLAGLGPMNTSKETKEWFFNQYRLPADNSHISPLGHRMVARFVEHAIVTQVETPAGGAARRSEPPAPLFVRAEDIQRYTKGAPLRMPLHDWAESHMEIAGWSNTSSWAKRMKSAHVVASSGWQFEQDVKLKSGLIAHAPGDAFTVVYGPAELKGATFRTLEIEALRSYEKIGAFTVSMATLPATADALCPASLDGATPLSPPERFDCLGEEKQSVPKHDELFVAPQPENTCLVVNIRVDESSPPRAENKVKLMSIVLVRSPGMLSA